MQPRMKSGFIPCCTAIALFAAISLTPSLLSGKTAYRIFKGDGASASYGDMIAAVAQSDVAFFGELHGNPIAHWLQYEAARDLHETMKGMIDLGAEMLETDQQALVDEFLSGVISRDAFLADARLWPSHARTHQRLLDLALEKHIRFIATCPPRRYSALVFSKGPAALGGLVPGARSFIVPIPFELPPRDASLDPDKMGKEWKQIHLRGNWFEAQAMKDATMAYFIAKNRREGSLFLHFNGGGHSDFSRGIIHYLSGKNPKLKVTTITTIVQDDIGELAGMHKGRAHFIVCVPESMGRDGD